MLFRPLPSIVCTLLLGLMWAPPASAGRAVKLYEVVTVATDTSAAATEAMRTALIRVTGHRDADSDPAFASLLSDARRYVQVARPVSNPAGLQLTLDGPSIERVIAAAGRSVWPRDRPVVLVTLTQPAAGTDLSAARRSLEATAVQRGLPVIVSNGFENPAATANGLNAASLLANARARGADAALVALGRPDGNWLWTLYTAANSQEAANSGESFEGSLESGVHGAADALASATQTVLAQPESEAMLRVLGVQNLHDYAVIMRSLVGLRGVRSATLVEAAGDAAIFRLRLRGGVDALAALLTIDTHLRAATPESGMPVFQYQP